MIAKVDANQREITLELRKHGASVQPIHTVGKGCPDLLVGYEAFNFLFELKDGSKPKSQQKLTRDEERWHEKWQGQVEVVTDMSEVLRLYHRYLDVFEMIKQIKRSG